MLNDAPPTHAAGLFPWRLFAESLACSFRLRVLLMAAVGVALTADLGGEPQHDRGPGTPTEVLRPLLGPLNFWSAAVTPFARLAEVGEASSNWRAWAAALGVLATWSLVGGGIARVAGCQLTLRPPPGIAAAMARSAREWPGRVLPVACLLFAAAALLVPLWVHGLLMRVPALDVVSALLLPIPLLLAVGAALLVVLLAVGWPLIMVAQAVERPDAFDAVSRAYGYVTQRPVQFAAYLLTALVVAAPVCLLVEALRIVLERACGACLPPLGPGALSDRIAQGWLALLVTRLPMIFYASYAWCAAVATYLLLRRDVDGVQLDELHD